MPRKLIFLLPPLFFLVFAGLAFWALTRSNPDELPSALAGQLAPSLAAATPLGAGAQPAEALLRAPGAKLVNFWASWCGPCRLEHPVLEQLAAEGVTIIGVNYKDKPDNARAFLAELGDPYTAIGADETGRIGLDWGIYGVPETFVIDGKGTVVLRYPGPITADVLASRIRPALEG